MKKTVIAIMILTVTASCKKFLSERSQNEIKPETTVAFQELLNGDGYLSNNEQLSPTITYMEDDVEFWYAPPHSEESFMPAAREPYTKYYMWQPFMNAQLLAFDRGDSWSFLYSKIKGCNVVLDNIATMAGPQRERNYLQGQALGLRAFYYFMLVNIYAKPYNAPGIDRDRELGVPLKLDAAVRDEKMPRQSLNQTYSRIQADLETAIPLLEQNGPAEHPYHFTALAAHLLASRMYLYREEWEKAIPHADWVLQRRPFLEAMGAQTATPGNWPVFEKTRREVIWFFSNTSDMFEMTWIRGRYNDVPVFGPSPSLTGLYEAGDKRKDYYFVPLRIANEPDTKGFLRPAKTLELKRVFGRGFRVCEAYLNRAEANIQLVRSGRSGGSIARALEDINAVRASRFTAATYKAVTISDPAQLYDFYKDERRREFCFETNRWFDLRRYGMPAITHGYIDDSGVRTTYTLKAGDRAYVMPIPDIVMQHDNSVIQNELAPVRNPQ